MRKTFFLSLSFALFLGVASAPTTLSSLEFADAHMMRPLQEIAVVKPETTPQNVSTPVRIIIPSIGLDSPIQSVGTNTKGEMDVPSGKTNNVGWYKHGTKPGEKGAAVLDAHVFAAFENLKFISPGDDVYVETEDGSKIHFRVADRETYQLSRLSPKQLFAGKSPHAMNLITCAGALTADGSTYTHRLVVYTTLVG